MNFSYADLISGDSIFMRGVGHLRSPKLKELLPTKGIGEHVYNMYLNVLTWNKSEAYKFLDLISPNKASILKKTDQLSLFDLITIVAPLETLLKEAFSFFLIEEVAWDKIRRKFIVTEKESGGAVGEITRDNFDEVRDSMLKMNYLSLENIPEKKEPHFTSEKAKLLWERAQQYGWDGSGKKSHNKKFTLGNIVSKICASNIGYNLFNIYDLTIYQLYDQFFQLRYLHGVALGERVYTNYGGKKFDPEGWLNPITK